MPKGSEWNHLHYKEKHPQGQDCYGNTPMNRSRAHRNGRDAKYALYEQDRLLYIGHIGNIQEQVSALGNPKER